MSLTSERDEVYHGRISRRTFFRLVQAAKTTKHFRFMRQIATAWLTTFPGDLEVQRTLAEAWLLDGRADMARPTLEALHGLDPENKAVFDLLDRPDEAENPKQMAELWGALQLLNENNLEQAEKALSPTAVNTEIPLLSVLQLKLARRRGDLKTAHALAAQYHQRWPACLQFRLGVAQAALELGRSDEAVAMLHRCAADDAAGLVTRRWLGEDHPFRTLWPEKMAINFDLPLPAEVVAVLGWNQLPAAPPPSPSTPLNMPQIHPKSVPSDDVVTAEAEIEQIARRIKQPGFAHLDGRFPIYVIFSVEQQLKSVYGSKTAAILDTELHQLAAAIRERKDWGAMVFYPDNANIARECALEPVSVLQDPWKLKLALVDLDRSLAQRGERIGALLIVGGPAIVPFHRLPNPLDDPDAEVLSDNPYATQDANYYIPEWPVGRLPGESGADAGLVLQQIRQAIRFHRKFLTSSQECHKLNRWFDLSWWQKNIKKLFSHPQTTGFGYTAAAWRRSSQAVFRAAGQQKALLASPPQESTGLPSALPLSASLGYYNLHGVPDSAEWFGQRALNDPLIGPDYPVALTPTNLRSNGHRPDVIFSEACYGANLRDEKTATSSIALRFLSIGAQAFVGSTCTSYGAVTMPLAGADLMAYRFWKLLRDGHCVGEALLQAKIQFAQELMRRQGYLDGEDQKTLISFILLGDPLSAPEEGLISASKGVERTKLTLSVKTVCDRSTSNDCHTSPVATISDEALQQVKQVVAPYLPGLEQATVVFNASHPPCAHPDKPCPGCALSGRAKFNPDDGRTVVVFSQQTRIDRRTHTSIARVTLNREGKVTKLALSR